MREKGSQLITRNQRVLTWKPSVSSVPFTRGEGAGEPDREPDLELGLELDLDDGREPD